VEGERAEEAALKRREYRLNGRYDGRAANSVDWQRDAGRIA